MKDWVKTSNHVGIFLAIFFIISYVWYWIHPMQSDLHFQMLQMWFYGFTGMNLVSFFLGIVQSFIWGYVGVAMWRLACVVTGCGKCCKK